MTAPCCEFCDRAGRGLVEVGRRAWLCPKGEKAACMARFKKAAAKRAEEAPTGARRRWTARMARAREGRT